MIESLHISNYALIDNIDIAFKPGLNIITGETGAGKSIMLGALSLLLGARADMKSVRNTDRKTVIEAVFGVGEYPALKSFCEENDIEWDDNRCILRRRLPRQAEAERLSTIRRCRSPSSRRCLCS